MKKFFVLLGTLAVAALFFSCANSSDGNSAALLGLQNTATKTTVSKTIKIGGVEYSYTIVDGQPQASGGVSVAADGTVTITAADGSKVAVKGETITYTTADSKVYVGSGSSGDITLANRDNPNDKITAAVTSQTKTESPQQKQSVADHLPPSVGTNELAGKTFISTIGQSTIKFESDTYTTTAKVNQITGEALTSVFSYTYNSNLKVIYYTEKKENGKSGATPNGGRNTADFIWIKSYSISGNTLKMTDSDRYPAGKDFSELYNYYSALPWQIKDDSDNTVYNLYCSLDAGSSYNLKANSLAYHQIMAKSDGLLAYKVSSVDANAIHTCATGTRADTTAEFSFTDENKTFKYTMTKSENGAVVDIEGLGKINIVYATPATIPDFTSAPEYTLQQSVASHLPPSVGTNELAGKTFTSTSSFVETTAKYETETYTSTMTYNYAASVNNTAYSMESKATNSYAYDSNSKVIYNINQNGENSFVRNGVKLNMPNEVFSTDAEFVAFWKKYYKILYDLASDDYIETLAKKMKCTAFASFGYTDSNGATPVSNEIIAMYNKEQKLAQKELIRLSSYSVSDTGLKFISDYRYPAGKDFDELYNYYSAPRISGEFGWQIMDSSDNTAYNLHQFSHIMKNDKLLIYKVSSVDANAIHTCAIGTRADTTAEFSFTDENKTFKYTTTKSENGAVVDIEGLGKINIVYATPATIPDFSTATEYTLQQ